MKKIMNSLKSVNKFGLVALMVVAGMMMAFKAPAEKQTKNGLALQWFQYLGDENGGGEANPNNYMEIGDAPTECTGSVSRCAIQANEQGTTGKPVTSELASPNDEVLFD